MMPNKSDYTMGSLFQFSPYIAFLTIYISLYCYTLHATNMYNSSAIILAGLPLFALFIATIYAFSTYKESVKINEKIKIFLSGAADLGAMNYYFTIICIAVFNNLVAQTNGVLTAITLGLLFIPTLWIMPILFIMSSIFSIILCNLPAAIIIFMPIAHGIAQSLQINSAFMAATIIGGALCGAHASLYWNNIRTLKPSYLQNILERNFWNVFSAAIATVCIVSKYTCTSMNPEIYIYLQATLTSYNYITLLPYCFLLVGGIIRMNILANIVTATCIAVITEIMLHKVMFLDSIATMFYGFSKESIIVTILLVHLLIAGLTRIIKYNGGFTYIIEKLKPKKSKNFLLIQLSTILTTIITSSLVIIDSLCFDVLTDHMNEFTEKHTTSHNQITNLFYITTTTIQSIVPYASIMFITIHITHSSYIEIMTYMIYPTCIAISTIVSIVLANLYAQYKKHTNH